MSCRNINIVCTLTFILGGGWDGGAATSNRVRDRGPRLQMIVMGSVASPAVLMPTKMGIVSPNMIFTCTIYQVDCVNPTKD